MAVLGAGDVSVVVLKRMSVMQAVAQDASWIRSG
jgi:hypothetical protein